MLFLAYSNVLAGLYSTGTRSKQTLEAGYTVLSESWLDWKSG